MRLQIGHGVPPVVIGLFVMALGSGQNYQSRFVALQPLCVGPITSPCRRFYFVVASCFRCVVFLFHRGVVFSFCRFYFVVASCFRVVLFLFRRGVVFSFRRFYFVVGSSLFRRVRFIVSL